MPETKRAKKIAFQLTESEHARVKRVASASGDDTTTWCRNLALKQSSEAQAFTRDEQLVYEEIATLNVLIGHGDGALAWTREKLIYEWKMLRQQADDHATEIVQEFVKRRKRNSRK